MTNQTSIHTKLHSANSYAALTEQAKAALLTSRAKLTLEIGDVLEGNLIKIENKLFLKELTTGQLFATHLTDETLLGQLLKFEVKGFEGAKLLLALNEPMPFNGALVEQVMEQLNLPKEEAIKQLIGAFTNHELPLQKESILQTYRLQQVTDLPGQVLLNILKHYQDHTYTDPNHSNKLPMGYEALKQMGDYKEESLMIALDKTINEYAQSIEESRPMLGKHEVLQNLLGAVKDILPKTVFREMIQDFLSDTTLLKESNQVRLDKVPTSKLIEILTTQLEEMPLEESLKKCLKACFTLEKDALNRASKETKGLKDTVLFKEEEIVKVLVKEMKQLSGESQGLEKALNELEEQLLIHHKLREEGQYYTFPFMSELGKAKGKVYFYKPYKKKQKQDKSLYTVIALDMPTLKQMEIHVHQIDKNLKLAFYTQVETVKKLIEKEGYRLLQPLGELGYQVEQISFAIKEDRQEAPLLEKQINQSLLKGFDYQI